MCKRRGYALIFQIYLSHYCVWFFFFWVAWVFCITNLLRPVSSCTDWLVQRLQASVLWVPVPIGWDSWLYLGPLSLVPLPCFCSNLPKIPMGVDLHYFFTYLPKTYLFVIPVIYSFKVLFGLFYCIPKTFKKWRGKKVELGILRTDNLGYRQWDMGFVK